jgi:hypothetical protein
MSTRTHPAAPAYDAAEKGTLEIAAPAAVLNLSAKDEKKMLGEKGSSLDAIPGLDKMTAPKPPVKKKVSKWVLWKLWFNTYR